MTTPTSVPLPSEKPYTVNGFYFENLQAYTDHFWAASPEMAIELAVMRAREQGGTLLFTGVFEGHQMDVGRVLYVDPSCTTDDQMAYRRREWGGL